MKYLILFENFEEHEDFWSDSLYCGCGCCSKCNGQDDCECCDNCLTTIYNQEDDSEYERNEPKDEKEKYLDYLRDLESTSESSAIGGLSISGSGISGQPVGLAGQTLSTNWASGTGKEGGGYLNVPYNPGGANRMQQKIPVMGLNHGPRTGKKSREKRLDLKALRASFKKRKEDSTTNPPIPGEKKVMSFDDFEKSDINTIKKESLNESLILESKITDLFKKYDMLEIKRLLKEKLEIDENSTKQEVAKKLFKFYLKLQLKTLKYELGALLGGFIFYFLSIVLDVAGVKPFVTDGTPTMPHFILWGAGALLGIIKTYKDTKNK